MQEAAHDSPSLPVAPDDSEAMLAEVRRAASSAHLDEAGLALTTQVEAQLARYLELLLEWNERAGLTGVTAPSEVGRRHFGEPLALLALLRSKQLLPEGASVVDLGTGGGFPGLPMRIVDPSLRLTLVEAQARRCRFLEAVVEELGLAGVEVVQARAEDAGRMPLLREHFDVAVARALAPLAVLVELAIPLLRTGGLLATPKGSRAREELEAAAPALEALRATAESPLALPLAEDAPPQLVLLVRRSGDLDPRYPRRSGIPEKRPLGSAPPGGRR